MVSDGARSLNVDYTVSTTTSVPDLNRVDKLLDYAASTIGLNGELGIWLCTDEEIADLHLRFMDVPGATDVITFPGDPDEGDGYLGDVAVSTETASLQAVDAGHSAEREVADLCLHGLLHIAGYDDLDEGSRDLMIARQEELLDAFERIHPGEW